MNVWEYAIARHFAQLLAGSESRVLTKTETGRLEVLGDRVEVYEGREIRATWNNRPAAETARAVVDDLRREPRAGRRL